jgi:hypothetical protein
MTIADLTIKVKVNMDEYAPTGVALPFDNYITPMLHEAARDIAEKAPLHLLNATAIPLEAGDPSASIVLYANDKAYIPVPVDYVRLYEIKYPLWKKSIRKAFPVESPQYKIQENESLTPGYGRPFVGILQTSVNSGAAARYFECGKVIDPDTATLTPIALYVKSPLANDLRDILADTLCWLAASKIFGSMGNVNEAKLCEERFTQALGFLGNS